LPHLGLLCHPKRMVDLSNCVYWLWMKSLERGNMKSLLTLLASIVAECGDICSVDTTVDLKTIERRFENEGQRFLTVILPRFEKGLLVALSRECATPDLFPDFRSRQNLPVFLGGFMELIFDRATGAMLDIVDPSAIRSLRQICVLFKKIEIECTDEVTRLAFDKYVETDRELFNINENLRNYSDFARSTDEISVSNSDIGAYAEAFLRLSRLCYSHVWYGVDNAIASMSIVPKHGPGATADKKVANAKFVFDTWSDLTESVFPYWWYCTTRGYSLDDFDQVNFLPPGGEFPSRVIAVPKTQETPRIIAVEPTYVQYLQQGLASAINSEVDRSFLYDFISTEYQEPNQRLAYVGSLDGSLATLDLSEASDRIPWSLVYGMVSGYPDLRDALYVTRTAQANVPGHGVITLEKYASMGSALCFPIETMVFFAIALVGIERAYNTTFKSWKDIISLKDQVRIYGDDIIVPADTATYVRDALGALGSKVNSHKSFWTGKFRESCGKEYFNGHDVSVVKFRRELPLSRKHVEEMVSLVSFRNQLYKAGYWKTVKELDLFIESLIPFPAVSESSSALGRHSFLPIIGERIGGRYQRPMVRAARVRYRQRKSSIDGFPALMKTLGFKSEFKNPYGPLNLLETSSDHLLMGGRPTASSITVGMVYAD